jgi:hypothetical protein
LRAQLPELPCLLGEFGLVYDLDGGAAYKSGDFSAQRDALDGYYRAIEANLLHSTQWNYTADNDNRHGDQWNGEDLSIWSRDQADDPRPPGGGERALDAVVRPYARATAGEPLTMSYELASRCFRFRFRVDPAVTAPTEIFLPALAYPDGCRVEVTGGRYELEPLPGLLRYWPAAGDAEPLIVIRPAQS